MQKVEMLRTYNNEQIKKLTLEELQTKFLELQEIAKDGNIIIQKMLIACTFFGIEPLRLFP